MGCTSDMEPLSTTVYPSLPEDVIVTTETSASETSSETTRERFFDEWPIDEKATAMCGNYLEGYDSFEVTSEDLVDGAWADAISNSLIGNDSSPQLSWMPVDGAAMYAIYMVDTDSNRWLIWKSITTETELEQGWAPKAEYNGPHLGHGHTHIYEIYVIALKEPVERLKGAVDGVNPKLEEFLNGLDIDSEGNEGNIIAVGKISGTYGDIRNKDI